jgi:hypothetical protein
MFGTDLSIVSDQFFDAPLVAMDLAPLGERTIQLGRQIDSDVDYIGVVHEALIAGIHSIRQMTAAHGIDVHHGRINDATIDERLQSLLQVTKDLIILE